MLLRRSADNARHNVNCFAYTRKRTGAVDIVYYSSYIEFDNVRSKLDDDMIIE
jgi:hypothetical protein